MGSNHGLNQSTNFVGLMNSQQLAGYPQTLSFDSLYTVLPSPSSQVPLFSSQSSPAPSESEKTPKSGKGRRQWTPSDDRILISGWLNTSKDAVIGNDQRGGNFWKRVVEYISASPLADGTCQIGIVQCKQRWSKINEGVSRFCGTYAAALRAKASGHNDDDVLKMAYDMYHNIYKKKFVLEHCWLELRYDQKWCELLNGKEPVGNNKRRLFDDPAEASPSQTGIASPSQTGTASPSQTGSAAKRPPGRDATKAKQRRSQAEGKEGSGMKEYQTMWELKREDLLMKERLSKMQILDSLLAKKEPLTQKEEAIKEKLLDLLDD